MGKKTLLTLLAMLVGIGAAFAQSSWVKGVILDASTGEPVPFASVMVRGTNNGVSSDEEGNYSISVPRGGTLVFSSIGYKDAIIAPGDRTSLNIELEPDSETLNETIVVAFGTATKESFTGSATVVNSDKLQKAQVSNVTRAMEGKVAGVQMSTSSGSLGSSPSILIRGISSINAGNSPLYIVDGVPYSGDMNNINPADIESMTVLKDAASNALYGARGANGVIMITTKKAKAGDAVVNVDAKVGLNTKALQSYDYIKDPATFYEMRYNSLYYYYMDQQGMDAAAANALASQVVAGPASAGGVGYQIYTVPEGEAFIGTNGKINPNATLGRKISYDGTDYWIQNDDWMKETYKRSIRQEYNVSVSGTTGKASVLFSFGYLNDKGIVDGADMYRYTARVKADYQAKKWLKVGANAAYTNFNWNNTNSDENNSGSTGNIFSFAASMPSIYPVYIRTIDENGNISILKDENGYTRYDFGAGDNAGLSRPASTNSNALQKLLLDVRNSEGNALNATGFAEVSFLRDFKFTFNVGTGLDETRGTTLLNMYYGQFAPAGGTLSKSHSRAFYLNLQQLLSWSRTFAEVHHVDVLLGHEMYDSKSYSLSGYKTKLFSLANTELNGAVVDGQRAASSRSEYMNEGYFSRVQYDYAGKIYASASFRRDATSRFHPDYQWGNFWSLGAGWLINRENWFRAPWIDMLKLKASIGSQGNDGIGSYRYTDLYDISNNEGEIAVAFYSKGNKKISWETQTNFNTGIDFELFGRRVNGSVEYFYRKTADMLFFFNVPKSLGYSGYYDNIGDMRNSGLEFSFDVDIIRNRDLTWNFNFNATHYTNKVIRLPEERKTRTIEGYEGYASGNKFVAEGLPLNTFLMRKWAGVDHETGKALWYMDEVDDNGDPTGNKITTDVYSNATEYLCDDPTPKLYGGFGTDLTWKGLDFSVQFTYSLGGKTYDSGYAAYMGSPTSGNVDNIHVDMLDCWTPDNKDSDIPRYQYLDSYFTSSSDRFLVPASYLNIQNAQIGYTLPRKLTQKIGISRLRFYATCDNIYYWSYRKGLDPRYNFSGGTSYTGNSPVRTISGGINLTF